MFFCKKTNNEELKQISKKRINTGLIIVIVVICLAAAAGLFMYLKGMKAVPFGYGKIRTAEEEMLISDNDEQKKADNEKRTADNEEDTEELNQDRGLSDESKSSNKPKAGSDSEANSSNNQSEAGNETIAEVEIPSVPILPEKPSSDDVAEALYRTVDVGSYKGSLTLAYAQPDIPEEYHASIKLEIFDAAGATVYRYVSDAGWLSEPSNYDAAEKVVLQKLGVDSLENRLMILTVKVGDRNLESYATVYQLIQEYDGSRSITKAQL